MNFDCICYLKGFLSRKISCYTPKIGHDAGFRYPKGLGTKGRIRASTWMSNFTPEDLYLSLSQAANFMVLLFLASFVCYYGIAWMIECGHGKWLIF